MALLEIDLFALIGPPNQVSMVGFGGPEWERAVAIPELERMGYRIIRGFHSEECGFGPLVRAAHVHRGDETIIATYG